MLHECCSCLSCDQNKLADARSMGLAICCLPCLLEFLTHSKLRFSQYGSTRAVWHFSKSTWHAHRLPGSRAKAVNHGGFNHGARNRTACSSGGLPQPQRMLLRKENMGYRNPYKHMACIACKVTEDTRAGKRQKDWCPNTQEQLRQHHILQASFMCHTVSQPTRPACALPLRRGISGSAA